MTCPLAHRGHLLSWARAHPHASGHREPTWWRTTAFFGSPPSHPPFLLPPFLIPLSSRFPITLISAGGGGAAHRGHGAGRGPSCVFICSVMPTTRTRPHTHTPLSFSTLVITQDRLTTGYTCCLLQPNALYSTMDHYLSSVYYA